MNTDPEYFDNVIRPLMVDAKSFLDVKEREFVERSMKRGYSQKDALEALFAVMYHLTAPQAS